MAGAVINGEYYSFADIELTVGGLYFIGVKTINYGDDEGREYVRGTARNPIGMTAGSITPKGDIEFYLPAWQTLLTALTIEGLLFGGWRRVPIDVTVSYSAAAGLPTMTDVIPGVRLKEVDASQSQGDGALTRKLTLFPSGQILWNGSPSIIEPQTLFAVG
jgi:hypothetical protein